MAKRIKDGRVKVFRLLVEDGESGRRLYERHLTRFGLWFTVAAAAVVLCTAIFCLVAFTPVRTAIPGYPNARSRAEAVQNAIRIDSLESIVGRWEFYAENLRRVVDGEQPLTIDSLIRRESPSDSDPADYSRQDSLLRSEVTASDKYDLSDKERSLPLDALHFFSPLKGTVSKAYDPVLHPYVDITAPDGSLVMSVLDGTVIFAGWNDESGYTIAIQHEGDIVTVYKHNRKLLKSVGDRVSAGASVGLIGQSEDLSTGDHLHFELWYRGEAVDPTRFISF